MRPLRRGRALLLPPSMGPSHGLPDGVGSCEAMETQLGISVGVGDEEWDNARFDGQDPSYPHLT